MDALVGLLPLFALSAIPTADGQCSAGTVSSRAAHHTGVGPAEGAVSGRARGVGTAACQCP